MDEYERRQRVAGLLEHGEHIRWTGASATTAYIAGHIPLVLFMGLFCAGLSGNARDAIETALEAGITTLVAPRLIFMLIAAWFVYATVRGVVRDLSVDWVVTDRRVYRISGKRVTQTDIRSAASVEITRRDGERGSIVVSMPETHDQQGDRHHASVALLGIDHLSAAYAAITAAQIRQVRTI